MLAPMPHDRPAPPAVVIRRVRPVAAVVLALLGLGLGCASSTPPPAAPDLVGKLTILETQQGFTPKQVRCVAEHATAALGRSELREFASQLSELQTDGSTAGMSARSLKVFTDAISACTVAGG